MNHPWTSLDLDTLKALYESKVQELNSHLDDGKPWEGLKDIRDDLSKLSAFIYEKVQSPEDVSKVAS
jgi:hypothetical protein